MKYLLIFTFFLSSLFGQDRLETIYHSLDPFSISELFAFFHLYPDSDIGKKALKDAWTLMNLHREDESQLESNLTLPSMDLNAIISLVNKQTFEPSVHLTEEQLKTIESVSDHLYNRKLKGFTVWDKQSLMQLSENEIDLARALLIYQFEKDNDKKRKIREYEASLDLMALQILARLSKEASHEEKIQAINQFIFHEKRFRFPPHSLMAKDIDVYTFLPSVLDNRQGVCLGVSILYLSLAQRLKLPLEIITPPGHIYLRYPKPEGEINIETTARGISLPSKTYLGINTRSLQTRTIKEVVGLSLMNQAAVSWQREDYKTTVHLYEEARPFLKHDPLLKMLLGYNYLFIGEKKKGKKLLKKVAEYTPDHVVYSETTPEDYLKGRVGIEGIKTVFLPVDETRDSILKKQKELKKILVHYPFFRDGLLQLAVTQLQLSQNAKVLETLTRYHGLDPNNPTIEYYLSIALLDRIRYKKSWEHLKYAETITEKQNFRPDALKNLRHHLRTLYPDPDDTIEFTLENSL